MTDLVTLQANMRALVHERMQIQARIDAIEREAGSTLGPIVGRIRRLETIRSVLHERNDLSQTEKDAQDRLLKEELMHAKADDNKARAELQARAYVEDGDLQRINRQIERTEAEIELEERLAKRGAPAA